MVNRAFGALSEQLHERHDASDFETKTQDKLASSISLLARPQIQSPYRLVTDGVLNSGLLNSKSFIYLLKGFSYRSTCVSN